MSSTPVETAPRSIRAAWILPGDAPPIRDGLLVVNNSGTIDFVGPAPEEDASICRQDVAIIPAFVNAHTHLEFSSLQQPLGTAGIAFTDWIRKVIAWRRNRDEGLTEADSASQRKSAIQAGLEESQRSGTRAIGEIATSSESPDVLARSSVKSVVFLELIGLSADRISPLMDQASSFIHSLGSGNCLAGLSPHAPYSVHPKLLAQVVKLSAERRVRLTMHLAETAEEIQLLQDGTGPFVDLLQELNVWNPATFSRGSQPLDYLRILAQAHHALVIHGNYFGQAERDFLAENRSRMSVVYCPRTHAYFGHPRYPLTNLVASGVRVALGTDSRASNPDLEMLQELRFAASKHPDVAPAELLKMATLHGAQALGLDQDVGSLQVGKRAEYVTVPLSAGSSADPYSWL